jgi:hypothetical protein
LVRAAYNRSLDSESERLRQKMESEPIEVVPIVRTVLEAN